MGSESIDSLLIPELAGSSAASAQLRARLALKEALHSVLILVVAQGPCLIACLHDVDLRVLRGGGEQPPVGLPLIDP